MIFKSWSAKNKARCYDGLKAILVAVLITLGGTIVTTVNNHYTSQLTEKRQITTDARKEASAIARKITNKMNDRYLYSLRLVAAYNWNLDQEQRYIEYDCAMKRWNDELMMNLVDINRYFGKDIQDEVYKIIGDFNKIHNQIMKMHHLYSDKKPMPDIGYFLEKIVYPMDDTITNFADKLQRQLQTGNVDIYVEKPPLRPPTVDFDGKK